MAQRRKEDVRARFVAAAASSFAELGYGATTMAGVAERAGSSIGNLYKYFAGKEELFAAAVPEEFARELRRMTRRRIEALGTAHDPRALGEGSSYQLLADELLEHSLAHRTRVVILLARAEGTPYASFAEDFRRRLVTWALDYATKAYPDLRVGSGLRFAIDRAYGAFLASIAEALATFEDAGEAREVIDLLTEQHQAGLRRLFERSR